MSIRLSYPSQFLFFVVSRGGLLLCSRDHLLDLGEDRGLPLVQRDDLVQLKAILMNLLPLFCEVLGFSLVNRLDDLR